MHYYTRFKNHEHSYEVTHPQHKHTFIKTQTARASKVHPETNLIIMCCPLSAGAEIAENG